MFWSAHSPPECGFGCSPTSSDIFHTSTFTGRYLCLKCLNFDICQMCFLSGLYSNAHQKSYPVTDHCVQVTAGAMHQTTHKLNPCKLQQFKTFPSVRAQILLSYTVIFKTKEVANSTSNISQYKCAFFT